MRLAYLKLSGYKRFKETTVNLDRTLIAFIGPNEAGKSSIFQALVHMENHDPISRKELTKDIPYDNSDEIIELVYFIEQDDLNVLNEFNGIGQPTLYQRIKSVGGKTRYKFNAEITRDLAFRKEASELLVTILNKGHYDSRFNEIVIDDGDDEEEIDKYTLLDEAIAITGILAKDDPSLTESQIRDITQFQERLYELSGILSKGKKTKIERLSQVLSSLLTVETQEEPRKRFGDYLFSKKPQILMFDQANRQLNETYSGDEILDPPVALKNIFRVARLDHLKLHNAIVEDDPGEVEYLLIEANKNLEEVYRKYWNQDNVFPRIKLENDGLRILIKSANKFNNISDRSDGVKQFIALLAFVLNNNNNGNIILLIDEAEIHLHYNAQVDLVKLFEEQQLVDSIYYTTHSAGCLPSDLGTGIRVVQQVKDNNGISKYSEVKSSVWQNTSGFSPILMALGASQLAISLARKALLAEGETEPIILPRLFREASGLENLTFQIGPGLASISTKKCKELELEAAKVLFFVDGDSGGEGIKAKLVAGKIDRSKIFSLPKGNTIEDFIKKEKLLEAVNDILVSFHGSQININASQIPEKGSVEFLKSECKKAKMEFPSKVLIAEKIVMQNSKEEIIKNSKKRVLIKMLETINTKFE